MKDLLKKKQADDFQVQQLILMWELSQDISKNIQNSLPSISILGLFSLLVALVALRLIVQKILVIYFNITQSRPQHIINTLQYSYFYHLSIVILVLVEVEWNMFDLSIWIGSYIGVGIIRKAIHVVRIQKELVLNDCSYNKKIMQILSASKIFGLMLFLGSIAYFLIIQGLFFGTTIKLSSLLLFPTLMLTVDSAFLLFSSHISQRQILVYYNQNINELPPNFKISLIQKIFGNSIRIWHYINILKIFLKGFFQRIGLLDCMWILSVVNACYISSSELFRSIKRYRSYNKLVSKFNKIFRPSATAPDQSCVICMSELLNCRKLSSCGHMFHYKCLFQWIQNKNDCPICRNPIELVEE